MRSYISFRLKHIILWMFVILKSLDGLAVPGKLKMRNRFQKQRRNPNLPVKSNVRNSKKTPREPMNPYSAEANNMNVDQMRARAGILRTSIAKQQLELQKLERTIICCSQSSSSSTTFNLADFDIEESPREMLESFSKSTVAKLKSSTDVLMRKLARVEYRVGPKNQNWKSVGEYVGYEAAAGARIVSNLVKNPNSLRHLVDPETPTLATHLPAILARLDQLEDHIAPILERVLNNKRHLPSIEPYLDEILERFDDIEPHLPWILDNVDALAPYTGLLLKHIDELLLYADIQEGEDFKDRYELAEQVLPYLEYYVSRLDAIGPHLPLLRPHIPKLLKHNRIGKISPHIDRLFIKGYSDLSASANMDVLLFWFGWSLRIPGLPRLFFSLPGSPKIVSFLANRLPKRFLRGYCKGVSCYVDNDYGGNWNKLSK